MLQTFCELLYIHVHVRKAIEGIGFLLSPLRALAAVAKRTRKHQKTQFAPSDFHSFFSLIRIDERRSEVGVLIGCIHSKANQKFKSDNQTLFFRFQQGNWWRHENLWHRGCAGGAGVLSDFEFQLHELGGIERGWRWGVEYKGNQEESYKQKEMFKHWNVYLVLYSILFPNFERIQAIILEILRKNWIN
jgi:hypothetical protein